MRLKIANYRLLIFFLSLLPTLLIFQTSLLPHTHDGPVHLARMAAWHKAFLDGQFPPRWAADLNFGYGGAVLIFIYPWPYFLASLFLSSGLSLVLSFKLVLALSFLFSGVFMFLFARAFFDSEKKAFLIALLYQFASFRLVEIMIRGAFGEVWVYIY